MPVNAPIEKALPRCARCKGKGEIRDDNDLDAILSCPDCEGTGEEFSADALADICPICAQVVCDDEEWTRTDSGEIAHLFCVEKPEL